MMFKAFIIFAELVTAVSLAQSLFVGGSMAKKRLERDILGPKGGAIHTACVTDPLKFQTWAGHEDQAGYHDQGRASGFHSKLVQVLKSGGGANWGNKGGRGKAGG